VVMDNLGAHKVEGVRKATEDRNADLLYLPPYSPALNPSEQAFAKLKALSSRGAARTVEGPVERHRPPARPPPAGRVRLLPRQLRLPTRSVTTL
jgi:transposase